MKKEIIKKEKKELKTKGPMIYQRMIDIMHDIEAVEKSKKNEQQGYNFRGIDDMYNAIHPLFKKHGVFILSEVVAESRTERQTQRGGSIFYVVLDVRFSFCAADGSRVVSLTKGEAMDTGDKGTNKAMSAALKYTLMQTFLIPTEELKTYNTESETYEEIKPNRKEDEEEKKLVSDALNSIEVAQTAKQLVENGKKYAYAHDMLSEESKRKLRDAYNRRQNEILERIKSMGEPK